MRLLSAPYSPYARMVRIVMAELALDNRVEEIDGDTWSVPDHVTAANPLGKIPTLVLASGVVLFDSRTICDYLCRLCPEQRLLPESDPERSAVLTSQALAVGLMDVLVERFIERWRPVDMQMSEVLSRLSAKAERCYDFLEHSAKQDATGFDLGDVAIAAVLSYAEFRFAEDDWARGRPRLSQWYQSISERPSMRHTALKDLVK